MKPVIISNNTSNNTSNITTDISAFEKANVFSRVTKIKSAIGLLWVIVSFYLDT